MRKNFSKNDIDESSQQNKDPTVNEAFSKINEEQVNQHAPSSDVAKKIKEWPTISNAQVEQTLSNVGEAKRKEEEGLPVLGPYELENGAVYLGQWKHGRESFIFVFCFVLVLGTKFF